MNRMNCLKITLLAFFFLIATFSCNNNFESENLVNVSSGSNLSYKLSENEAIISILSFLEEMDKPINKEISTRSKSVRKVKNVEVIGEDNKRIATYASVYNNTSIINSLNIINADTFMYIINFEGNMGYAIMSADKRSNVIYAIIDEGYLDAESIVEIDNPGFVMFMEKAIETEVENVANYNDSEKINTYATIVSGETSRIIGLIRPMLKTKWGQGYPYNQFSPNGYTGCVMTASAQILSYFKTINNVNYYDFYYNETRSSDLNWNEIVSEGENSPIYGVLNGNTLSSLQVANLMRHIGLAIGADYTSSSGTGVSSDNAISWLRSSGKLYNSTSFSNYNPKEAYEAVYAGKLVYIKARRQSGLTTVGHAWVMDGGFKRHNTNRGYDYYMHCNWGWDGLCDGYYCNKKLAPMYEPGSIDITDRIGSSTKDYNLEQNMAIIGK